MYLDNDKISRRQVKRLIVFNIFSISFLILPRIAVVSAGRDSLIAILLALLLALLFIIYIGFISKNTSGNLIKYSKDECGKFVTFIVGVFYIIKYFACLILCGKLFAEVIKESLLEDTNIRFIILMLILLSAYSASKGFEVRARITELLYFIVLVPLVFFLILGLKTIDLGHIFPLFTESRERVFYGAYTVFITFTSLEFLIFKMYLIEDQPRKAYSEGKESKKVKSPKLFKNTTLNYILSGLLIVGLIDILVYLVTLGSLGIRNTGNKLWSTINMIQIVDLPGSFLQRHDALLISIWMLSIFTLTSGFFYYLLMMTREIFNFSSANYMILPYIILVFSACIIPIDTESYYDLFEKYMLKIGIPGSLIIPLIIVILGKSRSKLKRSQKVSILIIGLFIPLALSGCSDMTEIEDRDFIQAIGVDYEDGQISLSLASPDLASYTDQGASDEEAKEKLLTILTGNDFYQMEEEYLNSANKRLDFSHLQVVILGREFLENKELYYRLLEYIENKYEISRNTLSIMSDSKALDLMELNSKMDNGIGNYIYQLYRINVLNKGREEIKLQDLLLSKNEGYLVSKLPILKLVDDSNIEIAGVGLIKNGRIAYQADLRESGYINLAKGLGTSSRIFIQDENENKVDYVIKLNKIQQTIEFLEKNDKPYMILRIEGAADLEKGLENVGNSTKSDKDRKKEINIECNKYIRDQIINLIETISKEERVDFLNVYRKLYSNKKLWLKYKESQDDFLEDLEYIVEVNIGI